MATRLQIRAARELLGMSQQQLAEAAGLARSTVSAFETGDRTTYESTRAALQTALENRGIFFTNGDNPGVIHRKSGATIPT